LTAFVETYVVLSGISGPFGQLSRSQGQVTHVLLTRAPLYSTSRRTCFSYDLHVLGTPPALALSQDQTLQFKLKKLNPSILLFSFQRSTGIRAHSPAPFIIPQYLVACQVKRFRKTLLCKGPKKFPLLRGKQPLYSLCSDLSIAQCS
jgi:hypothetical protein